MTETTTTLATCSTLSKCIAYRKDNNLNDDNSYVKHVGPHTWEVRKSRPSLARGPGAGSRPIRRITLAHKFAKQAANIMPLFPELQTFDDFTGDPDNECHIDQYMFRNGEYIGGMAAVIMRLIK